MRKYFLYIIIGLLAHVSMQGQTVDEILLSVHEQYSLNKTLQFKSTYNLYKTKASTDIEESYQGEFYKNKADSYFMKINHTDILSTPQVNLRISHDEKAILVTNPENRVNTDFDIKSMLISYDRKLVKDHGKYWEIILSAKKISSEQYYKIILHVAKDYLLNKQVFYLANRINFSKDFRKSDLSQPVLEVIYKDYTRNDNTENRFNSSNYLNISNSGKITLSNKINGYELIDERSFQIK